MCFWCHFALFFASHTGVKILPQRINFTLFWALDLLVKNPESNTEEDDILGANFEKFYPQSHS